MRFSIALPAILGVLLLGACNDLTVGDLNAPGVNQTQNSPTRVGVLNLATGLQIGSRFGVGQQNGYVALLGITGEEIYNFDPADPRFITEMVYGPLDGGSPAFGGNLFAELYANIRTANITLHAMGNLSNTPPAGMSPAEKEATLGYAQTLMAYDFLRALNTRFDNGIPVDVDIDPTGPPAPVVDSGLAFTHIINLLDSGATHLTNVGDAAFPFKMSAGYTGFDRTLTFRKFNRALRARVAVYRSDFAGALALLNNTDSTFIDASATPNLALGVFHTFTTAPGDSTNNLFDPNARALVAYPTLETDAQKQVDGVTPDARFVSKTTLLPNVHTSSGLSSDRALNVYKSPSDPVPIIRNEELILLRAEANIGLGNLAAAVTDINLIRQTSGNLPPYAGAVTQPALLSELLYNKRYSLLLEGGLRWIDLRRYGQLGTLPREVTPSGTRHFFNRFPFPTNECLARNPAPASGCGLEPGF
jgi:starch-binding outer membrane protein, SusD/RagB family